MMLSKREQYIAIVVAVLIGAWLVNTVLVSPLLAKHDELRAQIDKERQDYNRELLAIRAKSRNEDTWSQELKVLKRDKSEAESQLNGMILAWIEASGINQPSLRVNGTPLAVPKPGGKSNEKAKEFMKLTCRFTGSGGMVQVGRFLWQVQTSAIPVRITDMSISARKDNTDDLELNIGLSTLFLSTEGAALANAQTAQNVRNAASNPAGSTQRSQDAQNSRNTRNFGANDNGNNAGNNRTVMDNNTDRARTGGNGGMEQSAAPATAPATNVSEERQ